MNITIIRHSIRNRGGDKLILDYCRFLIENGHTITYWTNEVNTSFDVPKQIAIKNIPTRGFLGTMFFTFKTKFGGDIVIVDLIIMAFLAGIRNKRKVLQLAQDYDVMFYSSPIMRLFMKAVYWLTLTIMQIPSVAVSDNLAKKLKKYNSKNITSVPNGIDLNNFYKNTSSKFNYHKSHQLAILVYARSDYRKGYSIAVKTIQELIKLSPNKKWEIWMIGEENLVMPSTEIKVTNFGFQNEENLRDILSSADIFLSPSRHEGFGLLQLQAAACECAIVTTTALFQFEDGKNALVSPIDDWKTLANNLYTVLDNDELRLKLQKNARLLSEKYSLEKSCEGFLKVLNAHSSLI